MRITAWPKVAAMYHKKSRFLKPFVAKMTNYVDKMTLF